MNDLEKAGALERELIVLNELEIKFHQEYTMVGLTPAQRLTALSEIRKIVYLRSLLRGLIEPKEEEH